MYIGEKIAELRKLNNMTQRELAERLNVSDKVISKWETGKSLPDVETMLRLSKILGVSISELYDSVEKADTRKIEAYSEDRVWAYKKYSIISCFLVILSPLLLLKFLTYDSISNNGDIFDVLHFLLVIMSMTLFFIGIIFKLTQFVRLYSFSRTKFYQDEYNRVMKKYGTIFLVCFLPSALFWIAMIVSDLIYL